MRLFCGNFDFEHRLARERPFNLPRSARRINAQLATCMAALAEPGDAVWTPERPEDELQTHFESIGLRGIRLVGRASDVPADAELCPWGWSADMLSWAIANGWRASAPELAIVWQANSREFSTQLEREWGVELQGAATIHTLDEFRRVCSTTGEWVVKANFGMSARERILGRTNPDDRAVRWVSKQLAEQGAVYFEPWVERLEEFGFQFTIPRSGEPELLGVTPLLTDSQGTYRGSRLPVGYSMTREHAAIQTVRRAAQVIAGLGYFGPLGIDAVRYRTSDGSIRWRPLADINGRLTMGRLALGLRRLIAPHEHATWLHVRWLGPVMSILQRLDSVTRAVARTARLIRTSPIETGGRVTDRGSVLVAAQSEEALSAAEVVVRREIEGSNE
jgi:hypothetical protein